MAPAQRDWLRKIWRGEAGNRPSPHALLSQGTRLPFLPFAVHCARACGPGKYGLVPKADGELLYMREFPATALQKSSDWKWIKCCDGGRGYRFSAATPLWRRQTGGLFLRKIFQKFFGLTLSCRARATVLACPGCARKPPRALRFPLRNIDPARRRSRRTGTSDSADATAPAGAADTWTRPILRAQSARRILCTCSKDTCTSQTSQNIRNIQR